MHNESKYKQCHHKSTYCCWSNTRYRYHTAVILALSLVLSSLLNAITATLVSHHSHHCAKRQNKHTCFTAACSSILLSISSGIWFTVFWVFIPISEKWNSSKPDILSKMMTVFQLHLVTHLLSLLVIIDCYSIDLVMKTISCKTNENWYKYVSCQHPYGF